MKVRGGSKGARVEPSAVATAPVEDVSSSELSASTASALSLDDVHTTDVEVVRQRREKKPQMLLKEKKERKGTQA
jgi:hypothetical protein